MGIRRKAKNLLKDYGDFAHIRVLEAIARAEGAEGIEQNNRIVYWRKVLDALNNLPPSRGKQTKEKL